MKRLCAALTVAIVLVSTTAMAADYPAPREGDWVAKNFKFHTGETMPELKLHYTTVGARAASRCWCCTAPAARPRRC